MATAMAIPINLTSTTAKYLVLAMLHAIIFLINLYWPDEVTVQDDPEVNEGQVEDLYGKLLNGSLIDLLRSGLMRQMNGAGRD